LILSRRPHISICINGNGNGGDAAVAAPVSAAGATRVLKAAAAESSIFPYVGYAAAPFRRWSAKFTHLCQSAQANYGKRSMRPFNKGIFFFSIWTLICCAAAAGP